MRSLKRSVLAAFLLATLPCTGCYSWTPIKPTELPKLNGSFAQPIGQTGSTTVVAVSVTKVERPDGRLLEVVGKHEVSLGLKSGERLDFDDAVSAQAEADSLVIAGGNRAKTTLRWSDITIAEVSQYDKTRTTLYIVGWSITGALGAFTLASGLSWMAGNNDVDAILSNSQWDNNSQGSKLVALDEAHRRANSWRTRTYIAGGATLVGAGVLVALGLLNVGGAHTEPKPARTQAWFDGSGVSGRF